MDLFRAQFTPVWMCPQIAGFPRNRARPLSTCESSHQERAPADSGSPRAARDCSSSPAPCLLVLYSRLRAKLDSLFPMISTGEAHATPSHPHSLEAPQPDGREAFPVPFPGGKWPRPGPGKEKGACCSSPYIAPSLGRISKTILFLKGLEEREREDEGMFQKPAL